MPPMTNWQDRRFTRIKQTLIALLCGCACLPATAQLLDTGGVLKPVGDLRNQLPRTVEKIGDTATKTTQTLVETATGTAEQVTDAIQASVAVLNRDGTVALIEAEVEGGWRAVQHEWLLMLENSELKDLALPELEILAQTHFAEIGMTLVRFKVPPELDSRAKLQALLPKAMAQRLDRNHIYAPQLNSENPPQPAVTSQPVCASAVKIGMVDTAINTDHPAFQNSHIVLKNFLPETLQAPLAHGTAVAGLLVGDGAGLQPLTPKATLYAASVFYARDEFAQGTTLASLLKALNWLAEQDTAVVNMSLTGPPNLILEKAVSSLLAKDIVIVAAVGNAGPAAPPLFPAAYPSVIGATAVDTDQRIYRWSNRGAQVDFAAPGVSVLTARAGGDTGRETGTSMATPVVAAFAACAQARKRNNPDQLLEQLAGLAVDLGDSGRDDTFGYGLLAAQPAALQEIKSAHAD